MAAAAPSPVQALKIAPSIRGPAAPVTAGALRNSIPEAATALDQIPIAGVHVVCLGFHEAQVAAERGKERFPYFPVTVFGAGAFRYN